jgi:hypothetical protein
LVEARNRRL